MTSSDIDDVFRSTRDRLSDVGIEDGFFLDLLAARLVIERVGESDGMRWWDSLVLSETGRDRLDEVTPKTQVKARINLALKVGRKAESDRLPRDTVSLFSFGPQIETQVAAAIDSIRTDYPPAFDAPEHFSVTTLDTGWTGPLVRELGTTGSELVEPESLPSPDSPGALLLSDDGYAYEHLKEKKRAVLVGLLRGYGKATDELHVPYFRLENKAEHPSP